MHKITLIVKQISNSFQTSQFRNLTNLSERIKLKFTFVIVSTYLHTYLYNRIHIYITYIIH